MPLLLDENDVSTLMLLSKRDLVPLLGELAEAVAPGAKIVAELRREQVQLIARFESDLHREFVVLGHVVVAALNAKGGLILESAETRDARVRAIIEAANLEEWENTNLRNVYLYHYKKIAAATYDILNKMGLETTFRDRAEKKILKEGGKRLGLLDIKGDVKKSIFRAIEQAREEGINPKATARLIEDLVPKGRFVNAGSRYRSKLIARTETLHAQRISTLEAYRSTNYVKEVVALDGDSDEECAARNGETFTFDEAAMEADITHPNCVLAFAPVGT